MDLSKALSFAKEIEVVKQLIEEHYSQANRKNFESIKDDTKPKKSKNE